MSKVSISRAWDETKAVLARDGRLLLPVALALFVLPGIVWDLVMPEAAPGKLPPAGPWIAVAVASILISLVGQLAVIRLAMGTHLTVGESIAHGARRLIFYVASVLMWMLPSLLIAGLLFSLVSANPASPPPAAVLGLTALTVAILFIAVRFILTSCVASAEAIGPVAILARSWALTRGNWWRLFAFFAMFLIGVLVLSLATKAVFGLLVSLAFDGSDGHNLGWFLSSLVSQGLSALLSVVFFVMLARIYVQRAGRADVQASVPSSGT